MLGAVLVLVVSASPPVLVARGDEVVVHDLVADGPGWALAYTRSYVEARPIEHPSGPHHYELRLARVRTDRVVSDRHVAWQVNAGVRVRMASSGTAFAFAFLRRDRLVFRTLGADAGEPSAESDSGFPYVAEVTLKWSPAARRWAALFVTIDDDFSRVRLMELGRRPVELARWSGAFPSVLALHSTASGYDAVASGFSGAAGTVEQVNGTYVFQAEGEHVRQVAVLPGTYGAASLAVPGGLWVLLHQKSRELARVRLEGGRIAETLPIETGPLEHQPLAHALLASPAGPRAFWWSRPDGDFTFVENHAGGAQVLGANQMIGMPSVVAQGEGGVAMAWRCHEAVCLTLLEGP